MWWISNLKRMARYGIKTTRMLHLIFFSSSSFGYIFYWFHNMACPTQILRECMRRKHMNTLVLSQTLCFLLKILYRLEVSTILRRAIWKATMRRNVYIFPQAVATHVSSFSPTRINFPTYKTELIT